MRFMIWEGEWDNIFEPNRTMATYQGIFDKLEIPEVQKVAHIEPYLSHWINKREFDQMMEFLRGNDNPPLPPSPYSGSNFLQ